VIRSFRDGATERLFRRERNRAVPPNLQRAALKKLMLVHAAESVSDLRVPPGNRLEKLRGGP
jgi:proteic killer suppression protein